MMMCHVARLLGAQEMSVCEFQSLVAKKYSKFNFMFYKPYSASLIKKLFAPPPHKLSKIYSVTTV